MYSGTTLTRFSGRVLGAHQKFDSVSRRHLTKIGIKRTQFPGIRMILHFEGKKGPDAIKRKSPAQDEPWHYIDPFNDDDTQLLDLIDEHYHALVHNLQKVHASKSEEALHLSWERVAFEAAWLAHSIVDGLTPAHHYPYEEKLTELREGQGLETRNTTKAKLLLPGETRLKQIKNNWKMWGPRGLMTAHAMFEMGVATMIKPLSFSDAVPTSHDVELFEKHGIRAAFLKTAREIAVHDMYHHYLDHGWTPKLAWQVRHQLGPTIVRTITLAWHQAIKDAEAS